MAFVRKRSGLTLPFRRRTSNDCHKVRHYTKHHSTSDNTPILPQSGWRYQLQLSTCNN